MQGAFAMGCCPMRCSGDDAGVGSTGARGKCHCRIHQAEQGATQKFLESRDEFM